MSRASLVGRVSTMKAFLAAGMVVLLCPSMARADATAFIGSNTTPVNRLTKGAALGVGFAFLGLELEYATTADSKIDGAPSLTTGMANALLQFPFPIFGLQPYATAGAGIYRETLTTIRHEDTSFGLNIGGGLKMSVIGPLGLRFDYRVFKLGSDALTSPAHRFYAGANLRF
jgi:opacity protein-like surface antigen